MLFEIFATLDTFRTISFDAVSILIQPKRMGKGNYVFIEEDDSTTVIFCLPEKVGVLADALKIFQVRIYFSSL